MTIFQGHCLTCGAYVGEDEHTCRYTPEMLSAAFDQVRTPGNWKLPIDTTVPADADQALITRAVIFYTGSEAEFTPQPDGRLRVQATGYYAEIGS